MTKTQLTELIATRAPHVPQRELEAMVNALFELMGDALRKGERIEIRGFGSFSLRTRAPREARNPKTGLKVSVPARKTLSFTVGKELRERIGAVSTPHVLAQPVAPSTSGAPPRLTPAGHLGGPGGVAEAAAESPLRR